MMDIDEDEPNQAEDMSVDVVTSLPPPNDEIENQIQREFANAVMILDEPVDVGPSLSPPREIEDQFQEHDSVNAMIDHDEHGSNTGDKKYMPKKHLVPVAGVPSRVRAKRILCAEPNRPGGGYAQHLLLGPEEW